MIVVRRSRQRSSRKVILTAPSASRWMPIGLHLLPQHTRRLESGTCSVQCRLEEAMVSGIVWPFSVAAVGCGTAYCVRTLLLSAGDARAVACRSPPLLSRSARVRPLGVRSRGAARTPERIKNNYSSAPSPLCAYVCEASDGARTQTHHCAERASAAGIRRSLRPSSTDALV